MPTGVFFSPRSFSCANGADDDLFWMYFTVSSDASSVGYIEGASATAEGGGKYSSSSSSSSGAASGNDGHNGASGVGGRRGGDLVGQGALSGGLVGGADGNGDGDARLAGRGREGRGGSGGGDDDRIETGCSSVADGGGAARLTVVSNDEMRNHRMALLEPVPFKR